MAKPGNTKGLKVKIDEDTAQGVYANLAMVAHGEAEFVVDFMFMQPGRNEAKVGSRVILSPRQAKRLLGALGENIGRYEKRFGTIPTMSAAGPDDIVH
jgi:hypothetical protein